MSENPFPPPFLSWIAPRAKPAHALSSLSPLAGDVMAVRWWFKELREPGRIRWTWRSVSVDGSIEVTSSEFKDYGAVVFDAIKGGFRPLTDHWIVETPFYTTHYKKGQRVVIVPNEECAFDTKPPRPPLRPLAPRPSERKGLRSSVPRKLRESQ